MQTKRCKVSRIVKSEAVSYKIVELFALLHPSPICAKKHWETKHFCERFSNERYQAKSEWNVQGVPQWQATANPRHQEEEKNINSTTCRPALSSPSEKITMLNRTGKETRNNNMSRDMTKPTKWLCAQRRLRSVWASVQSDQSLRSPHEESLGP